MRHNDPGQYRMTHKHSLHIRLAKWRLSDLRERLIFANKLFTRISFLFVFWFVVNRHRLPHFLRRFSPLQSESPEQTALIFAFFPRPSKSFNICQRCCLTNWAIADVGQDAFDVEMNVHNHGKRSKWINLLQAGKSHFL